MSVQLTLGGFQGDRRAWGETWPPIDFGQATASKPVDGRLAPVLPGASKWFSGGDSSTKSRRRSAYDAYIRSKEWGLKRYACILRASGCCERCSCKTDNFEIHHKTYKNFTREPLSDLEALCKDCHPGADLERERAVAEANEAALYNAQLSGWLCARGNFSCDLSDIQKFEAWLERQYE
jgi:hypothetical protein